MHPEGPDLGEVAALKQVESVSNALSSTKRLSVARTMLRTATNEIHERMHRHPTLARLAAGTIERDEYRRVLARSYGFYAVAEPALGFSGQLSACLRDDLADLGVTPAEFAKLPRCALRFTCRDQAELIGARYVLLGASLGGKVMARAIAARTDGQAALPVRFLLGMGENDWKTFAADLESNLPDSASRERAVKSAEATFAAYEEWMTVYE